MKIGRSMKVVVAAVALVVTAGACQPGWVNAMTGSGEAPNPALEMPTSVAPAPDGSVYIYDASQCAVYRRSGGTLALFAGTPGTCGNSGNGGPATAATIDAKVPASSDFGLPEMYPMTVDGSGNLYFFGDSNWTLRRVDAATGVITAAFIPNGPQEYASTNLAGLATDRDGSIVVLLWTYRIQGPVYDQPTGADVLRFDGGSFTTVTSWNMSTLADHVPDQGAFGLAVLPDGSYLTATATYDSVHLFRIDATTGAAIDVASDVGAMSPWSLTADALGNAFVSTGNQIIRVGPDGSSTVIAGTGTSDLGLPPQYGLGTDLNITPLGLAITRNGNLVFSSGHTVYHLHDPAHAGASSTP